jgi:hypothetical protein
MAMTSPEFHHSTPYESLSEALKKSIDLTIELVKQQITLSAVLIGFALAFTRLDSSINASILKSGVLLLTLSFVAGIFCISILSTRVGRQMPGNILNLNSIRFLGVMQGLSFVAGVIFLSVFILIFTVKPC